MNDTQSTGQALTGDVLPATPMPPATIADSTTGKTTRPGTFSPGHDPRRNAKGRPRKGESFAEKYIAATQKNADEMIEAHVKRSKGTGAVAARDFELAAAYHMGRPVQKYVGVVADAPYVALLQELTALDSPQNVDASAEP